jgi:ATP-binding cassette subfamily F protein 3
MQKIDKELGQLEIEIEKLEEEKTRLEEIMTDPDVYANPNKLSEINDKYNKTKELLEVKNTDWEALVEQIESLE